MPPVSSEQSVGLVALLGGAMVGLFGAGSFLALAVGESLSTSRLLGSSASLLVGPVVAVWGRSHWNKARALAAAREAAIPDGERVDDVAQLAAALGGELLMAEPGPASTMSAILEDDGAELRPERHERVVLTRHAVALVAYWSHYIGRKSSIDAGPGLNEEAHWRVCSEVETPLVFQIWPKNLVDQQLSRVLGAPSVALGEAAFDSAFRMRTDHLDWLRSQLTPELRAALLRNRCFVLRCERGRVEVIWAAALGEQTRARFEDAAKLVTALARALAELPAVPYR